MPAKKKDTPAPKKDTKKAQLGSLLEKANGHRTKNRRLIGPTRTAVQNDDKEFADEMRALLVTDLKRVYNIDKKLLGNSAGRQTYRAHGWYSENMVKLLFGQWAAFQRKAGLAESLSERTMLRNISRTDRAQDVMRYAERHVKPWDGAYQDVDVTQEMITALTCSDLHSKFCDPFARRVFMDVLESEQPDICDINGDLVDYPSISRHRQLPGSFTMGVGAETRWGKEFLAECRQRAQNSSITFRLGNHDVRLIYALAEGLPQLSDMEHMDYNIIFGLDDNEIGLCARSSFLNPTARMKKNDTAQNWNTLYGPDGFPLYTWTHGFLHGKNAPLDHMKKFMTNGTNGHLHAAVSVPHGSMHTGVLRWDQTGCMAHPRAVGAGYVQGPIEALGWTSSFLLTKIFPKQHHISTQHIMVGNDIAEFNGYIWEITAEERTARAEMLLI